MNGEIPIIWRHQAIYAFACFCIIIVQLIPFDFFNGQGRLGDTMVALTLALVIRKPSYTPIWLIALAFFFADIMLGRALGLWTLLMLLAQNIIRSNLLVFREMTFLTEWANIAGIIAVMVILEQLTLSFVSAHRVLWGDLIWHTAASIIAYGAIVLLLVYLFKMAKPASNERTMRQG